MTKEKPVSPEPIKAPQQNVTELSDGDLDKVTGGTGPNVSEIVVTKRLDKASTKLFFD